MSACYYRSRDGTVISAMLSAFIYVRWSDCRFILLRCPLASVSHAARLATACALSASQLSKSIRAGFRTAHRLPFSEYSISCTMAWPPSKGFTFPFVDKRRRRALFLVSLFFALALYPALHDVAAVFGLSHHPFECWALVGRLLLGRTA